MTLVEISQALPQLQASRIISASCHTSKGTTLFGKKDLKKKNRPLLKSAFPSFVKLRAKRSYMIILTIAYLISILLLLLIELPLLGLFD